MLLIVPKMQNRKQHNTIKNAMGYYLRKKAEQGLDVIAENRIANKCPVLAPQALQKRLALKRW
jgi:hypothetical protein